MTVIYVVLGMLIDSIGLLLLTLPLILPLVSSAGLDPIWFGIILIKLLEIGLVTPPVGLNVYMIKGALGNLVRGIPGCRMVYRHGFPYPFDPDVVPDFVSLVADFGVSMNWEMEIF